MQNIRIGFFNESEFYYQVRLSLIVFIDLYDRERFRVQKAFEALKQRAQRAFECLDP